MKEKLRFRLGDREREYRGFVGIIDEGVTSMYLVRREEQESNRKEVIME